MKHKFKFLRLLIITLLLWQIGSYVYRYFQPMEVVDIVKSADGYYDYIVVKNPPLSERRFIRWWQENKETIKAQYDVPSESKDGVFRIGVWVIGANGYEIDRNGELKGFNDVYDQVCIMELPHEARCVDKKSFYARIGRAVSGWYYLDFAHREKYIGWGNGNEYIHWGDEHFEKVVDAE